MPVFPVDKPLGPTSHDVVARARRLLGTRRVGHAGTLDPLASGVLLLLAGDATKLSPWLTGSDKAYLAWVALGASTATLDAEGPIEERGDPTGLDEADLRAVLPPFLALREQVPPAFSAVKRGGEAAYRAARRGEAPDLESRPAGYRRIELLAFGPREDLPERFAPRPDGWRPAPDGRPFELPPPLAPLPVALFAVHVTAGTYLRSFARDLGRALTVPAHLAGLVRTRSGAVALDRATPLDALDPVGGLPEAEALPLPKVTLDAEQAGRVRQGQRLPVGSVPGDGTVGLLDPDGRLTAVAELTPDGMRLRRVWPA
jgi:tRNA pseudouridine55 synthase